MRTTALFDSVRQPPTACSCSAPVAPRCSRAVLELQHSNGIHDLGAIKWDMALCLLAVYIICYFSLWKGISTSGKVSLQLQQ